MPDEVSEQQGVMRFGSALNGMRHGHKLRRKSWPAGECVCITNSGEFAGCIIYVPQESYWQPKQSDILATDWELA